MERLRAVKEPGEIALIQAACRLADEALQGVLEDGLVGRTEREVALDLETRMRRLGAEAPSFPSIVAAGPHGALPHAQPRDEEIPADVLVTIDWGALHEGYCSDCTRTYATGEGIPAPARGIYELVLVAQEKGLDGAQRRPDRARGRRGRTRGDRGRRRGGALRPRARPWRGSRDPRGAPPVPHRRGGAAAGGKRRDGRARGLPAGRAGRADRGSRRGSPRRPRRPHGPAQGAHCVG